MRTLSDVLRQTTTNYPDRNAIRFQGETISYKELDERVDRLARGLIELGVEKGDKVGLWMPNVPEWVIAYFAIARIGAVVVPMNTRYKPHEVSYILDNSEATALFMVDSFVGIEYLEMIDEVRKDLPGLRNVIVHSDAQLRRCRIPWGEPPRGRSPGGAGEVVRSDRERVHPLHIRNDRKPEGGDALPPQHRRER